MDKTINIDITSKIERKRNIYNFINCYDKIKLSVNDVGWAFSPTTKGYYVK